MFPDREEREEKDILQSSYEERICEMKEDGDTAWNECFYEHNNTIYQRLIKLMNGRKSWRVEISEYEHIIIIGLERLA